MPFSSPCLRTDGFSSMYKRRKLAYNMSPSDFSTRYSTMSFVFSASGMHSNFFPMKRLMSFWFCSSSASSWNGCKCLNIFAMFLSGRLVTRNRIHIGSLQKWSAMTSSNSFRSWYSLSSRPSITISMFLPGSSTLLRGSLKRKANNSSTPISLRSLPVFLVNFSTRASLNSGRAWHIWQAKDWSINWGFR